MISIVGFPKDVEAVYFGEGASLIVPTTDNISLI